MCFNRAFIFILLTSAVLADDHHEILLPHSVPRVEQRDFTYYRNSVWSGVSCFAEADAGFSSVASTLTIPRPESDNKKNDAVDFTVYIGSADGDCTSDGSLQAGVRLYFIEDNEPIYTAWVWAGQTTYANIMIDAGDVVRLVLSAVTQTTGFFVIENLTNGDSAIVRFNSPNPVCGGNAAWMVMATGAPLAKFEDAVFQDTFASGPHANVTPITASGMEIGIINYDGPDLTSAWLGFDFASVTIHRL